MLGGAAPYAAKPSFWSDQNDVKLQIAGLNAGCTQAVGRDGEKGRSHGYFAGPQLLAVDAMNDPRADMVGKRMMRPAFRPRPRRWPTTAPAWPR
ncbi:hypothetical protein Ga0609869_001537 [Rhodovulum iodosum]|uniref:Reductase C-terminal domain-containing protein n=1 Tax=Rhodovulum iodosum TaxID=68291 RepID=A0ABV3XSL4_9RHOB